MVALGLLSLVEGPVVVEVPAAVECAQAQASAPARLQRAPLMSMRFLIRWRHAPSITPLAIGIPAARS